MKSPYGPHIADLPVLAEMPTGIRTSRLARILAICLVVFLVVIAVAPWQQTVSGRGTVIAYAPTERRQELGAPVKGRVQRWFVQEGSSVEEGDPIVEIVDNDPDLVERLDTQRAAIRSKRESYESRIKTLRLQIEAARASLASGVASAEAKLRVSKEKLRAQEEKLKAAGAGLETAMQNLGRVSALSSQGLAATRDLELATLAATKARTEQAALQADLLAAKGAVDGARADLDKVRAEGLGKIQQTEAKLHSGESDVADVRSSEAKLDVTIARQRGQLVRAPQAGMVLEVMARGGGVQVKQGDTLAILVPNAESRAAEVWVDGNDASLVDAGRKVRLQFEGWPAVQFSGWPSVAVGTFGGRVAFVDSHADPHGNFRVVVQPDGEEDAWPPARFLRQGVRAKGWILLEQVSIGFELWRRFNGFPPMLMEPLDAKKGGKGSSK